MEKKTNFGTQIDDKTLTEFKKHIKENGLKIGFVLEGLIKSYLEEIK